jgi:hypothetical protein
MADPLAHAISVAERAHAGQTDKAGRPYIDHVHAVIAGVESTEEKTAERLLAEGVSPALVRSVVAMTRQAGETYDAFILRLRADPVARRVKRADLGHNMDIGRLASVTETDRVRLERYRRALAVLAD